MKQNLRYFTILLENIRYILIQICKSRLRSGLFQTSNPSRTDENSKLIASEKMNTDNEEFCPTRLYQQNTGKVTET